MKIIPFPETRQVYNYDCGANCLLSVLCFAGIEEREDRIMERAGTKPGGDGTSFEGMTGVLQHFHVPFQVRTRVSPQQLRGYIDLGYPTIICLQAYRDFKRPYDTDWDDGHYVVAIGYDGDKIIFEDPSDFHRTWLTDSELMERWHDRDQGRDVYGWGCTITTQGEYQPNLMEHME